MVLLLLIVERELREPKILLLKRSNSELGFPLLEFEFTSTLPFCMETLVLPALTFMSSALTAVPDMAIAIETIINETECLIYIESNYSTIKK